MSSEHEKRRHRRVNTDLKSYFFISDKSQRVPFVCKNLSAKGLYGECESKPPLDTICHIVIQMGDERYFPKIRLQGKVVRQDEKGMGIYLTGIDFRDYEHLKNIIVFSSEDPQKAAEEFEKYLELYRIDEEGYSE